MPFQEAILALEVFADPMLIHVLYFRQNLLKNCRITTMDINIKEKNCMIITVMKDAPAFPALKPKFAELIEHNFVLSEVHFVATLLNPKTKFV